MAVAAQYFASRFGKRDPHIWVFGNVKGFTDNPRYLAEYIADEQPDLRPWWIARTEAEARMARAAGLPVALRGTRAALIQRRAGVAVLSNGFQDLEPAHLGGAYVVELRHGQGTKRILLDQADRAVDTTSRLSRWSARISRWYRARRLAQIDLIVAPGEYEAARLATAFGGSRDRVLVLGSPRFDILWGGAAYERVAGGDVRQSLGLAAGDFVVLWLPTWREDGDAGWLPPLPADVVNQVLSGTRAIILVKPHPYSDHETYRQRLPDGGPVKLLANEDVDVNVLLRQADVLITDYSSAAFDYALLERPILLFAPDFERYRNGQGLDERFRHLVQQRRHADWPGLLEAIRQSATGNASSAVDLARTIRAYSKNADNPGSNLRIVSAVRRQTGVVADDGS